jgi:anaerobic ribonucleoside-triphosphate reductase activating protein
MKLRIAGITKESIVDGPGIRYVIFTQGCIHNCPGCHNPETHDLNGGYEVDVDDVLGDISKAKYIKGVTFSGGDPFLQASTLSYMASKVKEAGYDVVSYTGYTFEELLNSNDKDKLKLLESIDVLIDGRFILSQKDLSLKFRGSRNQRVIDVKKSLYSNEIVQLSWR